MRIISKRKPIPILLLAVTLLALLLFVLFRQPAKEKEQTDTPQVVSREPIYQSEPSSFELQGVNSEERNPLLKRTGLPYEIDQYAITYVLDETAPFGVTLKVIDKTSKSGVSNAIRSAAESYLTAHGIALESVKIEYRNVRDAQ